MSFSNFLLFSDLKNKSYPTCSKYKVAFREKGFNFRSCGRISFADASIESKSSVERVHSSPLIFKYQMTLKSFFKSKVFCEIYPLYLSHMKVKIKIGCSRLLYRRIKCPFRTFLLFSDLKNKSYPTYPT